MVNEGVVVVWVSSLMNVNSTIILNIDDNDNVISSRDKYWRKV